MKELNLTQGSVPKVLLQFAVPFLIANVLQALYGGADLFVVGQYDDSASVAAVAIGSQVMQTITGIILGITTGTTVLIAIAIGAKDCLLYTSQGVGDMFTEPDWNRVSICTIED